MKVLRDVLIKDTLYKLRATQIPDNVLGFLLKSIHFHTPWYFLLLYILLPLQLAVMALIPLTVAFCGFFLLGGCFLTKVEKELWDYNLNIIDPFIYMCGDDVTRENRYTYTLFVAVLYFTVVFMILCARGCFHHSNLYSNSNVKHILRTILKDI